MHLSSSSYRPALLSVDCPRVLGYPRGARGPRGRQEGAVCLLESPLPHLPRTRRRSHVLARAGGDRPELLWRRALQQVERSSRTPHGPRCPHPCFRRTRRAPFHSRGGGPRTTPGVLWRLVSPRPPRAQASRPFLNRVLEQVPPCSTERGSQGIFLCPGRSCGLVGGSLSPPPSTSHRPLE